MPSKKDTLRQEPYNNKVYQVLQHLDNTEHKRLLKYLYSPYFNQSQTLTKLYEILFRNIEKGKPGFDREVVWQKLFPDEPFDDVNFRKYCSDLLKQVEGFMAQEIIARDETKQSINTLEFVVQRKIEVLYNSAFRQAREMVEKKPYRSLDYYFNTYLIERLNYAMMDFDVKVNMRANIEEISYNLDVFYWIEKVKLYSTALSHRKTGNYEYDIHFVHEIVHYLQNFPIDDIPELTVYYYTFLTLFDEENVENYYKLKALLDTYGGVMPQKEAVELYDSALHYCTGKLNKGIRPFLQEYFNLFENAIKKGIFLEKGELAPWRFNNIIGVAVRLGKLDWAESFVDTYKDYLPVDTRENTYTFNLARVYLYQKKYDKVLDLLRDIEYEDIGYNLISKAILTITYYELDEHDALDSFTESFRVFLNRHKNLPQQRRRSYLNLLKYVRRLTRLAPGDKDAIGKLRDEITRDKAVTVNHEWLLEKLAEL
ncbi:MAG: hypothetical protein IPJ82_02745 [Lewinellaceae bacterium]|nr:hypothetical protein [Lewinellaceae bacterium]